MKLLPPSFVFAVMTALFFAASVFAQERLITKAIEVRALSFAEAGTGIPVKLRGIVVFVEAPSSSIFVQDETSTTFFRTRQVPLPRVGDEIELQGATRMGLYLPGLDFSTFNVLGRRALPPGIPARYDDLVFSRYHYQRVAVEGVIRSVSPLDAKKSRIRLAMESRVIEAHVEVSPQPERSLVDHRVRITGLAVGVINKRRQMVQPHLRVLDWSEVEVLAPAPPVADVPQISAEELLAFRVTGHGEQRVRIEGLVTAVFSQEHVFLRQGTMAFGVRLGAAATLEPGDRIAIAGFPEMDRSSASVVDAELVSREPGPPPVPDAVEPLDTLDETHDCKLVTVTGMVRDAFKTGEGTALLLAGKKRTLQVRLPVGVDPPATGARVQVTGILQAELTRSASGFAASTEIVSLRARGAGDLVVLQKPSWWTARRLGIALGVLAALSILAALWIVILRTQVRHQTEALRRRIESEAALEERQRIAREFHDTLEQELAGVSLRLDALATREIDEKGRNLITGSRNLVSRIQAETRDLISDLRDANETAGDLTTALAGVAARHAAESGVDVQVEPAGDVPLLPATTVHDLRMIARESITNAIKHGHATKIVITLERSDAQLTMRIVDNGGGFDVAATALQKRGHFGCAGIRERARKIGADVTWESGRLKGTTVEVTLPIRNHGVAAPPPRPDAFDAASAPHLQQP